MMHSKGTEEEAKTSVWWNMDTCRIPKWCDAGRIGECIKGALEKLGYSGPVTISAYGNLNEIPEHVLRGLSSTGITLKHHTQGFQTLATNFLFWRAKQEPPATMMVIADTRSLDCLFYPYSKVETNPKFNYVLASAIGPAAACGSSLLCRAHGLFWLDVLEGARNSGSADDKQEIKRGKFLLEKCSETSESGESAWLFCKLCDFSTQSVESFTTHRSGEDHLQRDYLSTVYLDLTKDKVSQASHDSHPKTATTVVKKKPKTLVEANKFKKMLKKRKKKLKKKMMTE